MNVGLPAAACSLVDLREPGQRQVDLAAHLDHRRCSRDPQRDRPDRAQVGGHVLADGAVAAGGAAHEHAVAVEQRDRQPVDLRLDHQLERLAAQPAASRAPPRRATRPRCGRWPATASAAVLDRGEVTRGRRAHALGGRVGRDQLGVLGLQLPQLAHQRVVLAVVDRRAGRARDSGGWPRSAARAAPLPALRRSPGHHLHRRLEAWSGQARAGRPWRAAPTAPRRRHARRPRGEDVLGRSPT